MTGRADAYYTDYRGTRRIHHCYKRGYLYQGNGTYGSNNPAERDTHLPPWNVYQFSAKP